MGDKDDQPLTVNAAPNNLTIVTFPASLKLTSTNYLGWKTQIEALLHGLDLYKFIDGTCLAPLPTIATDGTTTPHKDFPNWFRQDRLLFGALVGSLSPPIIPLITNATSSLEAWKILATTYASPSRGHIKQLQHRLNQCSKTPTQSITDYMQSVKTIVDELSILGKKIDVEDVTDTILNGLDQTTYKPTIDAIHARDTPISFNELHEKLINHELSLAQHAPTKSALHQPASVFVAHGRPKTKPWVGRQHNSTPPLLPTPTSTGESRPFLGKCQWCYVKGHTLTNCNLFKRMHPQITIPPFVRQTPQANLMGIQSTPSTNWLFDSGASHHVTNDLNVLSLHAPYDGTEELVIGDGSQNEPHSSQRNGEPRHI